MGVLYDCCWESPTKCCEDDAMVVGRWVFDRGIDAEGDGEGDEMEDEMVRGSSTTPRLDLLRSSGSRSAGMGTVVVGADAIFYPSERTTFVKSSLLAFRARRPMVGDTV